MNKYFAKRNKETLARQNGFFSIKNGTYFSTKINKLITDKRN